MFSGEITIYSFYVDSGEDSNYSVLSLQNLKMAVSLNPFDLMGNLIGRHLLVIHRERI